MQFAPGPLYLLRISPYFAVPSTIVYACLTVAKEHLGLAIPTWLTVFTVVLARPTIFIFNRYYSRFADSRDAAANDAVIVPHVRESAFSIISKITQSFLEGYPCPLRCLHSCSKPNFYAFLVADVMLDWTQEYGNIYQLRLLTDNRVRCSIPGLYGSMKSNLACR